LRIGLQTNRKPSEFNRVLLESIDETIVALLSKEVLEALYDRIEKVYSVSADEIPYRLENALAMLEKTFGDPSSKSICNAIAKKLYIDLGLSFRDNPTRILVLNTSRRQSQIVRGLRF